MSIISFLLGLKPLAMRVALRVEKDSADGWSHEEKERLAVDLFLELVYAVEPWYMRAIPVQWQINAFKTAIRAVCAEVKKLKKSK